MRSRLLIAALVVPLLAGPAVAAPPPPEPLPVATTSKAPIFAYSALPFSEAAGPGRAFLGAGDIRVMRADASDDRSVTTGPATEFEPAFSPNGKLIAFSSDRADISAGRTDIWLVRRDGTGMRRVTTGLNARGPAWSPDGKRIAASTDSGVVAFSATGKALVQVTTNTAEHTDFAPVWNSGGSHVIFTRTTFTNGATTGQSLWYAAANGSGAKRLLDDTAPAGYLSQPDVSPDGKLLTFLQADANGTGIWLADLSGKLIRRLAFSATGYLNSPTFSPDGQWVLFTHSGPDGRSPSSMRLVNLDATKTKLVARIKQGNYYAPSWDPSAKF
ncbi:hypothetical protein [Sporichthya sp.]|uniref:TolB family protein n=1 Tax=Sporichthya sp. TaxID=65475 RepID=UPI0017A4EFDC|nr:hypothetical protein [Sporichthya sp.]MBA3745757.1 PD40 domain-containing protein [Sporichthya sp.]